MVLKLDHEEGRGMGDPKAGALVVIRREHERGRIRQAFEPEDARLGPLPLDEGATKIEKRCGAAVTDVRSEAGERPPANWIARNGAHLPHTSRPFQRAFRPVRTVSMPSSAISWKR